jgi:hypothetical protein
VIDRLPDDLAGTEPQSDRTEGGYVPEWLTLAVSLSMVNLTHATFNHSGKGLRQVRRSPAPFWQVVESTATMPHPSDRVFRG